MKTARPISVAALVLFFIFLFSFFYRPVETEDIWFHLKAGEWIAQHHAVPRTDIFSDDHARPWIFRQWLGSLFFYGLDQAGGTGALKLFRAVWFVLIVGIFLLYGRRRLPLPALLLTGLALAYGLGHRALLRPFIFNYLLVQLFYIQLFAFRRDGRLRHVLLLLPAGLLWANLHDGCLVFGASLLGLFGLESLLNGFDPARRADGTAPENVGAARRRCAVLAAALSVFLLLTAATPYGVSGALYLFKIFQPGFIDLYGINQSIMELRPPGYLVSGAGTWFYLLLAGAAWAVWSSRGPKFLYVTILALYGFLFLYGARFGPHFALAAAYVTATAAAGADWREPWQRRFAGRGETALLVGLGAIFLVLTVHVLNQKIYVDGRVRRYVTYPVHPYHPDAALEFLQRTGFTGPMFNDIMNGGYVLWAGYPRVRPFLDGRLRERERLADYRDVLADPEANWPRVANTYGFRAALLDSSLGSVRLLAYLGRNPEWQIVFLKGNQVIFGRRGDLVWPPAAMSLAARLGTVEVRSDLLPLLRERPPPGALTNMRHFLDPPPRYVDLIEEAINLMRLGYEAAAVNRFIAAVPVNPFMVNAVMTLEEESAKTVP